MSKRKVGEGLKVPGFEHFGALQVIAWTGGCTPPAGWPSESANTEQARLELAVFKALLDEQVDDWRSFYGCDDVPSEILGIFEGRARYDAWAMSREGFPVSAKERKNSRSFPTNNRR